MQEFESEMPPEVIEEAASFEVEEVPEIEPQIEEVPEIEPQIEAAAVVPEVQSMPPPENSPEIAELSGPPEIPEIEESEIGVEATPVGDPAYYPHPTIEGNVIGPEQKEIYASVETLAEKPAGQGPKSSWDAPPSGVNSNPPIDPGDGNDDSNQNTPQAQDADYLYPEEIARRQKEDPLPRMDPIGTDDKVAERTNREADEIEKWARDVPGGPDYYMEGVRKKMEGQKSDNEGET